MYNVKEVLPAAIVFADLIARCCKALHLAITEFPNFKKSSTLKQALIAVNTLEEEGDQIYIDAVRGLYETSPDPLKAIVWSELFDRFEDCCDACEHAADVVESVVMKNS